MTTRRRLTARFWTGLLLVGVGAYLAFAVSFHATAFDPRTVGYLLIMAGVLAMTIPRRGSDRVRRSMLMRHYQQNTRQSYPRDLLLGCFRLPELAATQTQRVFGVNGRCSGTRYPFRSP